MSFLLILLAVLIILQFCWFFEQYNFVLVSIVTLIGFAIYKDILTVNVVVNNIATIGAYIVFSLCISMLQTYIEFLRYKDIAQQYITDMLARIQANEGRFFGSTKTYLWFLMTMHKDRVETTISKQALFMHMFVYVIASPFVLLDIVFREPIRMISNKVYTYFTKKLDKFDESMTATLTEKTKTKQILVEEVNPFTTK